MFNRKFHLLILFFLLINTVLSAQNIDSLLQIRDKATTAIEKYEAERELLWAYDQTTQLNKIQPHINALIQHSNKIKDTDYKAEAYMVVGGLYFDRGKNPKADSLFTIALQYATQKELKAQIYGYQASLQKGNLKVMVDIL